MAAAAVWVLWALASSPPGRAAEGHEACQPCHLQATAATGAAGPFALPGAEVCLECHAGQAAANNHPLGPVPEALGAGLPLVEGRMTCLTCHDPHGSPPGRLRLPARELCSVCH